MTNFCSKKKFENLGKILSKAEQKHILGGDAPGPHCPTGESNYCCDYTNAGGNPEQENVCSDSSFHAKAKIYTMHPGSADATCELA